MLHRLKIFRGLFQVLATDRYQHFFQILTGVNHAPEVRGGKLETPGIGQRMLAFGAEGDQIRMAESEDAFLAFFSIRPDHELHVHRIGVAN